MGKFKVIDQNKNIIKSSDSFDEIMEFYVSVKEIYREKGIYLTIKPN